MSIIDPVAGPVNPWREGPCSSFSGDGRSDRCAWCDHTRQSHPDYLPPKPGSCTTPCRYYVTGFWPRRRWLWWVADSYSDGRVWAWTPRGVAEKIARRHGPSVALHENHLKKHPNGPGRTRTLRSEKWHHFGHEYHREGCIHATPNGSSFASGDTT